MDDENCIGAFEAILSGCGFNVADGCTKVKKVLKFVEELGCSDDEFRFLIYALREVDVEKRIEKKIEEAKRGDINAGKDGGESGETSYRHV